MPVKIERRLRFRVFRELCLGIGERVIEFFCKI